jgi:hypothetical protein
MTTHPDLADDAPDDDDFWEEMSILSDPTLTDNDRDSLIDSWDHDDLD